MLLLCVHGFHKTFICFHIYIYDCICSKILFIYLEKNKQVKLMHNLWNNVNKLWKHMKTYRDKQNRTNIKKNTLTFVAWMFHICFSPTCQVTVSRFYQRCIPSSSSFSFSFSFSSSSSSSTASCRQQWVLLDLSRPSGHCQTSTASSRSQWALPDLSQMPERMSEYIPNSMSE